jgi:hypothetical protein
MKKADIGMLVVMTLTLGLATRGESAKVLGCLTQFSSWVRSNGELILRVEVGNKWFNFHPDVIKISGSSVWLTRAQMAAWEPLVANLRAAARAKINVQVRYHDRTKKVSDFQMHFNRRCR